VTLDERKELATRYIHLRKVYARRFSKGKPWLLEDYLSEANEIIWQAALDYRPERGVNFETFVSKRLNLRLRDVPVRLYRTRLTGGRRHCYRGMTERDCHNIDEDGFVLRDARTPPVGWEMEELEAAYALIAAVENPLQRECLRLLGGVPGDPGGLSYADIGEKFGVGPNSVKCSLARGKDFLRAAACVSVPVGVRGRHYPIRTPIKGR
jgi:DNA-directed RNA polymerase specialized sigma24 family protein